MVSAHGYDVCGPSASAKMTRQSSPAGASFPLADSPAGVWQEPPFLPASSLSPETWQLPGGLARVWFLPFLTNCPLYHCWEINDAGCHLFTSQPSAVRGAKIQAASTSWGHSRAFFFFRTIDLKNPVLQQVLERKNEVLCVLTQKIVTTQKCVISEHVQMEKCGVVGIQLKTVQVCLVAWSVRPRQPLVPTTDEDLVFIHQDSLCREFTEIQLRSSSCGSVEVHLTALHEDAGLIPGLDQWVRDLAFPQAVV